MTLIVKKKKGVGGNEEQIKDVKGFRSKQKEQTNDLVKKNVDMYLQNS